MLDSCFKSAVFWKNTYSCVTAGITFLLTYPESHTKQTTQLSILHNFARPNCSNRRFPRRTLDKSEHMCYYEENNKRTNVPCGPCALRCRGQGSRCWACRLKKALPPKPNNKAQCAKSKTKGYYEAFRLWLENLVKADWQPTSHPPTELAAVRRCLKYECHGRERPNTDPTS